MPRRLAAVVTTLVTALALAPALAGSAHAAPSGRDQQVLVLFKNQFGSQPATRHGLAARRAAIATDQAGVRRSLAANRARGVHAYSLLNAISATVSPAEAAQLGSDPSVAQVIKNQPIFRDQPLGQLGQPTGTASVTTSGSSAGACPGPHDPPSLEPEALQVMSVDSNDPHAKTARSLGYDGAGVKVGVIADGIDPQNTEFVRPDGSPVIVDYEDFLGTGLDSPTSGGEAFLDASSIAAQGRNVYDISHFDAGSRPGPCRIRIEGIAPGASLVMLDPFGPNGYTGTIPWLQAIDYAVSVAHVDVLNESIGGQLFPDDLAIGDVIDAANDAAVAAGITVVVCTGDEGVANTFEHPATDPNIISVGGSTTYRAAVQLGAHGAGLGVTGWVSNNITALSSAGFSQQGGTLDVVAPGDLGWTACTPDLTRFSGCLNGFEQPSAVTYAYGTSESAPLTAGVAALVIQAYAQANGGAKPSPATVKDIITSTADDIDAPAEQQGAGLVDGYRAVLAARRSGTAVVESQSQFNAVAPGHTPHAFTEQLTNPGSNPVLVRPTSRTLGSYTAVKKTTLTLDDATSPTYVDSFGLDENYAKVTFTVPAAADRLDAAIAYTANPALEWDVNDNRAGVVAIVLLDPRGRLASYSIPISAANHSDTQVSDPLPGRWTAYVISDRTDIGGTNGAVLFSASVARYLPFGSVRPSLLVIPGHATRAVTLSVQMPSTPGDTAGSLVLAVPGQRGQSVPVTLRSLARLGTPLAGLLTGGNGDRAGYEQATAYYQLDVPRDAPVLNASIALRDDPSDQFFAFLVDPAGQVQAYQGNGVLGPADDGNVEYTNSLGAALRVQTPAAGRWTLIINFEPAVSGKELVEPYAVRFDDDAPTVTASDVPHGVTLAAGTSSEIDVQVTNTGPAPVAYYIDPRLSNFAQYDLPVFSFDGTYLGYEVPSRSTSLTVSAVVEDGVTPVQIDLFPLDGDPHSVSEPSTTPSVTATGDPLTTGLWATGAFLIGPYPQPPPPTFALGSAVVTTEAFDTAVTSPTTGDPWLWTLGLSTAPPFSSVIAQPGQTVTIPVDVTPNAPVGTHVRGTVYVEDESDVNLSGFFLPDANVDAAVPYEYTVG